MVLTVKCWMENADMANSLFLILKMYDVACQLKKKKKKIFFLSSILISKGTRFKTNPKPLQNPLLTFKGRKTILIFFQVQN
jgi:hypothetical protein